MSPSQDDIAWVSGSATRANVQLFLTDPYMAGVDAGYPAKLIYASIPAYGQDSIRKGRGQAIWYSVANRLRGHEVESVEDGELQRLGIHFGLTPALGVNGNLSQTLSLGDRKVVWSEPLLERFSTGRTRDCFKEIAEFYQVPAEKLHVTGGAQIFDGGLELLHDLDIVVPITCIEAAERIARSPLPRGIPAAREFGMVWPFRWRTRGGVLVCPFFVFSGLSPVLRALISTGETLHCSTVTVAKSRFGLMNTPVYEVLGAVDLLAFRTRLVRGLIQVGQRLSVSGPVYECVGVLGRTRALIVTDPWTQVEKFDQGVLHAWRA